MKNWSVNAHHWLLCTSFSKSNIELLFCFLSSNSMLGRTYPLIPFIIDSVESDLCLRNVQQSFRNLVNAFWPVFVRHVVSTSDLNRRITSLRKAVYFS